MNTINLKKLISLNKKLRKNLSTALIKLGLSVDTEMDEYIKDEFKNKLEEIIKENKK